MRLGVLASLASVGFALIARAVARRDTAATDRRVHRRATPQPSHPLRRIAAFTAPVGKWYSYVPMAVAAAATLRAQGVQRGRARAERVAAGNAIVLSALSSFALGALFDRVLPQPPAPPGQPRRTKPVFPSGHALGPTAVGLTAAYALSRAALVHPGRAFLLAVATPVVTAGGRFVEERHWLSDIVGGALAGTAVAALSAATFELGAVNG
jgi:membrane-associated phospholipid phosphatase